MASLVGLRDRRERVIARLTECYERDLLDVDELDRLLEQAHAAESLAALDSLIAGLGEPPAAAVALHAVAVPARLDRKELTVMFSHLERTGHWVVPRTLAVGGLFGNLVLDFRDASISAGVTRLELRVTLGNVELIVPPWLAIDVDVSNIGGHVEECHRVSPHPDPREPVLAVTGAVRLGNLEVSTRLPGETRSEARRREKRERKAMLAARRRTLPAARGQM